MNLNHWRSLVYRLSRGLGSHRDWHDNLPRVIFLCGTTTADSCSCSCFSLPSSSCCCLKPGSVAVIIWRGSIVLQGLRNGRCRGRDRDVASSPYIGICRRKNWLWCCLPRGIAVADSLLALIDLGIHSICRAISGSAVRCALLSSCAELEKPDGDPKEKGDLESLSDYVGMADVALVLLPLCVQDGWSTRQLPPPKETKQTKREKERKKKKKKRLPCR